MHLPPPPPLLAQVAGPATPASDPLTGHPFILLRGGSAVEAAVFVAEYRRAHPGEKAALVLPAIRRCPQVLRAEASFTRGALRDLHPPWPEAAPGEDAQAQLDRALARLQGLGVPSKIVSDSSGRIGPHLILECDGLQFGWSPRLGLSYYNGLADPPARNSVIEGILFTLRYRREHPSERAFAYVDALPDASTPGRQVATAVYTRGGKVYSHHLLTGDLESPLKPSELSDPARVIAVTRPIYQARRLAQAEQRRLPPPEAPPAAAPFDPTPRGAGAELRAAGVKAWLEPSGALGFEWHGRRYAYTAEGGCFSAP